MELANNKQALFNYDILESFEAGLILTGPEVKSAKAKHIDLKGSYVSLIDNSAILRGMYIAPYLPAKNAQINYEPKQDRKLLLKKTEINKIRGALQTAGLTIVPLRIYTTRGLVKANIGLARGKKKKDKRATIKKRDIDRDTKRTLKYDL